jgi:hypothetical protein
VRIAPVAAGEAEAKGVNLDFTALRVAAHMVAAPAVPTRKPYGLGGAIGAKKVMPLLSIEVMKTFAPNWASTKAIAAMHPARPEAASTESIMRGASNRR